MENPAAHFELQSPQPFCIAAEFYAELINVQVA